MQTVALNMVPSGVNPIAYASQYDTARVVRFPLLNGAPDDQYSLSGYETLSVKLTKPDGSEVTFNVPNPGAGKTYVDVTFPYEACNQAGVCLGELRMESPGIWDFGSLNFILKVEADAYGDDVEVKTASGSIATFETALSDNVVELTATINPVQSGSGTPSPVNPRPISGFTECNITNTNNVDVTNVVTVAFGQTVYGGVLTCKNGAWKVNSNWGGVDLGSLTWTPYNNTFFAQLSDAYRPATTTTMPNIKCDIYSPDTLSHILARTNDFTIGLNTDQSRVHVYDSTKSSLTGEQFATAMSGIYATYELATPIEIDLTAEQVATIVGLNNVFHDANGEIEVKYLDIKG